MTAHLIVPLDGSRSAEAALPLASAIAARLKASVTLLHLLEREPPRTIHGEPHLHTAETAERYLAGLASSRFPEGLTVSFHVDTGEVANVARGIAEHGSELHADMLVMCVHGRRGVSEALFGSLAQKSLALGRVPVLMVRPSWTGPFACRSILVPLDGKPSHVPALDSAAELARAFGARLDLLTVVPTFGSLRDGNWAASRLLPGTAARVLEMSESQARDYLAARAAEATVAAGSAAAARVLRGDPTRRILKSARSLRSDLVVLATHGKAGAGAFWAGSVGSRVCAASLCPVLLVPATPEPAG
jgi:nucleotide-binding universal stress UspA family protein